MISSNIDDGSKFLNMDGYLEGLVAMRPGLVA
jgi:hypothetical protein